MRIVHCFYLLPLTFVAGCATHAVDNNYGSACQQMVQEQVYDQSTLSTALGSRAVESVDPTIANAAIESMRREESSRGGVSSAGAVSVSQQGAGASGTGGAGGGNMSGGGQ